MGRRESRRERLARRAAMVRLVLAHPKNRRRPLSAIGRMAGWQLWRFMVRKPLTVHFWDRLVVRAYPDWPYSWTAIYFGLPEYDDMMFALRYLGAGDAFIDVGANIGFYCLLAASVNAGAPIIAYEPHPLASERLRENASINSFDNIRVRALAVGDADHEARLTSALADQNHIVIGDVDAVGTVAVRVVTLDSDLAELSIDPAAVRLVKIDTEGFEARVLTGASGLLNQDPGAVWLVEVTGLGRRYGADDSDVHGVFRKRGYHALRYLAAENCIVPYDPSDPARVNVIFARNPELLSSRLAGATRPTGTWAAEPR